MPSERVRCCLYCRVSDPRGRQTNENQRWELMQVAQARGFEVVRVYEDMESAYKHRPAFERMMADARSGDRRWSVTLVWALDRLGRGFSCFDSYRELSNLGVRVISAREPWTDADGPARELLVAVMSWVSGWERERLRERTKAGLERARRQGKRIGRPRVELDLSRVLQMAAAGKSPRSIATELGCGATTIRRLLAAHDALGSPTEGGAPEPPPPPSAEPPDLSRAA